jgi:UPF0716 family protein affecting phage T7 exclusion
MVTLLTLFFVIGFLLGARQGNGCAGRMMLRLNQGFGGHTGAGPGELLHL